MARKFVYRLQMDEFGGKWLLMPIRSLNTPQVHPGRRRVRQVRVQAEAESSNSTRPQTFLRKLQQPQEMRGFVGVPRLERGRLRVENVLIFSFIHAPC